MFCTNFVITCVIHGAFSLAEDDVWCELKEGGRIKHGERTTSDPCQPCYCHECKLQCVYIMCHHDLACVDAAKVPGKCCLRCPNGPNCRLPDGSILKSGKTVKFMAGVECRCPDQLQMAEAICSYSSGATLTNIPSTTTAKKKWTTTFDHMTRSRIKTFNRN